MVVELSGTPLSLETVRAVAVNGARVSLGEAARAAVERARQVVDEILSSGRVAYGVNTGFGKLADVVIPPEHVAELQWNLVRSHACGVGTPLSEPEVRAMMLLRANVLAVGHSGARTVVLDTLIEMLNRRVHPVIPEKGSVGASGDLAPLAHLALVAIGEGEAWSQGERLPGGAAMQRAGLAPLKLEAKEGLALLNGTQAMGAVGGLALVRAMRLVAIADISGAMTLEALRDTPVAFDARIHAARPHAGQQVSAARLRSLMAGSEIRESHRDNDARVQDAYSLRCMPQVHGAVAGAIAHARHIVEIESGSATDNPLVFPDTGEVLSGGNFHGAPLALAFDYAGMAITELASISERRIERLVNPDLNEGLPPFLTTHPGLASGFMIGQITAVALLNESKVLSHPASVDNLPTSGGKEDHVSMGMTSALKLRRMVENAETVIGIELMAGAEGLEYRKPLRPGRGVARAYEIVRQHVARLERDRPLGVDFENLAKAIRQGVFDELCHLGPQGPATHL